jgi:hypothetical protein
MDRGSSIVLKNGDLMRVSFLKEGKLIELYTRAPDYSMYSKINEQALLFVDSSYILYYYLSPEGFSHLQRYDEEGRVVKCNYHSKGGFHRMVFKWDGDNKLVSFKETTGGDIDNTELPKFFVGMTYEEFQYPNGGAPWC